MEPFAVGDAMPAWMSASWGNSADTPAWLLAWRIGVALILGVGVAGIYRWARRGSTPSPSFLATLILLAALIAMVTQIIGDNVARAFSLVGALSVVRFRTVVKDTQDTAFVIFAVVVGMASGADHLAVALVGLGIIAAAAPLLWPNRPPKSPNRPASAGTLSLRITPADGVRAAVEQVLSTLADRVHLVSAATARKGASLDLSYKIHLTPGVSPADVVARLGAVTGVEDVNLRRPKKAAGA